MNPSRPVEKSVHASEQGSSTTAMLDLAAISHELRTPLQAIMAFSQLAQQEEATPVCRGYLEQIDQASRLMLRVVNDILDLSKLEHCGLEIQREADFDLQQLLTQVFATAEALRQGVDVGLYLSLDGVSQLRLHGDARRIEQILLNLLSNAIRSTDCGWVRLGARCLSHSEGLAVIRFYVADTGVGMAPAVLDALLHGEQGSHRPFGQSTRGGTGYGLKVVRSLLSLMDSAPHGASVPGGGSLIWFDLRLPILRVDDAIGCEPPMVSHSICGDVLQPTAKKERALLGLRVLVIDDSRLNQAALHAQLGSEGVAVVVAGSCEQARAVLKHRPVDVVLIDVQLPDGSGVELARWMRQEPGLRDTPFAMVSAHISDANRDAVQRLGALACLLKPYSPSALVNVLHQASKQLNWPSNGVARTQAGLAALSGVDLKHLFSKEWPRLRQAMAQACALPEKRGAVHAIRGSLAVLGHSPELKQAKALEEMLIAGEEPSEQCVHAFFEQVEQMLTLPRGQPGS